MLAVVVQARMGSSRLPGKILREVAGRPLLGYLLERLDRCRAVDAVIIATSDDPADDACAAFCARHGVPLHRGPLHDVAGRFAGTCRAFGLDAFVRVSGDSPLLDPALVDRAAADFRQGGADVVSNVYPRTAPHGQSVEAVDAAAFLRAERELTLPFDREHVTPYLYANPDRFVLRTLPGAPSGAEVALAVDTEADLARIGSLVDRMRRPHWTYGLDELVALAREAA